MEAVPLTSTGVRQRAARGAVLISTRGAIVRIVGLAGNVVLARLLLPHDFGLVALGLSVVMFVSFITDAGFAAVLIRRAETPDRNELRALVAAPLVGTILVAAVAALCALWFGNAAGVIAVMCTGLTLRTFRAPATVVLERDLRYSTVVLVETVDVLVFYGWAVPTLVMGWGVWGPATAVAVQNLACVLLVWRLVPTARVGPRWAWGTVRALWRAGLAFQGMSWAALTRDQLLVATVGAAGGASAIGLWSVSYRILQVPWILLEALWRVSYPAMQRLIKLGEDTGPVIRRALRVSASGTAGFLACLVGAAPGLIPALFGKEWSGSVDIVVLAAVGVLLSAPLSSVASAALYAYDRFRRVVQAIVLQAVSTVGLTLVLYPVMGVTSVGVGWLVGSAIEAVVLGRALRPHTGPVALSCAGPAILRGIAAGGAGLLLGTALVNPWAAGVVGGTSAFLLFAALCFVGERESVRSCAAVVRLARAC